MIVLNLGPTRGAESYRISLLRIFVFALPIFPSCLPSYSRTRGKTMLLTRAMRFSIAPYQYEIDVAAGGRKVNIRRRLYGE